MTDFPEFPKIPRLNRDIVVTEKLDGTNALVSVSEDRRTVVAGSRSRWITPDDDNFGFARWVEANVDALRELGPGLHYGEWWGAGVQRRYGLTEKRFSLFNVARWSGDERPACCHVVPVLYRGPFSQAAIVDAVERLRVSGSIAAPGFTKPEGVIIFHAASGHMFKVTVEKDEERKSATPRAAVAP